MIEFTHGLSTIITGAHLTNNVRAGEAFAPEKRRSQSWSYPRRIIAIGMPSMEAMACGAALVTYDNGGCRDYPLDGRTALVARRRDVADPAQKLKRLVTDATLRDRVAREAMAFIRREFDWERAVGRLEELLSGAS